jgi:disulfide bond formation protein DsbB
MINLLVVAIVAASLVFAIYYLEGILYLEPCPLCMVDRAILVLIGLIALIALMHNSSGIMLWMYTGLGSLFTGLGIAVSARHIWLQGLPPDQVPECGPDLSYMLDVFPLAEVIKKVLSGSGQCAEVSWTFLGLTIPQQTLLLFVLLLVMIIFAHIMQIKRQN